MSHQPQVRGPRHRRTAPSRWVGLVAASLTVTAVTAVASPLAPRDVQVVHASQIALTAASTRVDVVQPPPVSTLFDPAVTPVLANLSTAVYRQLLLSFQDPQQQEVIGDFFHGGIAGVLKKQATSRLQSPDQTQILNDFFEGGVYQSEAHRFLQLFTDPDQHQFISDLVTGGLVQVVRNRLLDATTDPGQRAAIIGFFPDEVTDYRGGPIAVVQRRLLAAAKGNPFVIGLVNGIFENPVVVAVQHVLGGGPLVGTPLHELPPITPDAAVAPPHTATVAEPAPTPTAARTVSDAPTASARHAAPEPAEEPPVTKVAPKGDTENKAEKIVSADVVKSGNKVEPAGVASPTRATSDDGSSSPSTPVAETPPTDDTGGTKDADDSIGGATTS
ncbi:hypothetical protein CIW49_27245 [Mycolicibacterium sp. P1-18]|uniref:hypothetical protein n=1 Tax=Mycolicibacterium sp. P1-18 TaxID=2024615 RepID=UPI0011F2CCF8|nr:hypothetical protein [Mycolicibacterium sp. P1-18]KAA0093141.1 hypothetical protein CIW49_27245 [Mycolicibacterium sp. P1-18]